MASNRKKVEPPAYNDPGWGDSISVSKKARQELAENTNPEIQENKSTQLSESRNELSNYQNNSKNNNKKRSAATNSSNDYNEMSSQVEQINEEINRAVTEIEGVLERFLNQLSVAVSNFFLAFYSLFLKAVLIIFVQPLKNAGKLSTEFIHIINNSLEDLNTWLSGKPQTKNVKIKKVTSSLQQAVNNSSVHEVEQNKPITENDKRKMYPAVFDGIRFGELASQGIVFLNIKNIPMYNINQKSFSIEEEQYMLDNAINEIRACAKLAKSLPSPNKGRYINKPMIEILEKAKMEDLKSFLQYVYTHPKPFTDRQLRLSEAFATWAHKGAPV